MDFNVGDRVSVEGLTGTVICISAGDLVGVQFDDENYNGHRCVGVTLKAGSPSPRMNNCWWVTPSNLHHCEVVANDN